MPGLFLEPVVLNDGAADVNYNTVGETEDNRSFIVVRTNLAAGIVDSDRILVKQNKKRDKSLNALVSKVANVALPISLVTADKTRGDITWNLTLACDPNVSEEDIQRQLDILISAASTPNFVRNLRHGMA